MRFSERKEKKAARICRSLVEIEFLFLPFSRISSVQYEQPPAAGSSFLRRTSSAEKVLLSLHIQTTKRESRLLFLSPFLSSSLDVGESSSASCSQSNVFSLSLLLAGAFLELRRRDEKHLAGLEREGASTCYLKARSEMPPSSPPPLKKKKKQERSEHKSYRVLFSSSFSSFFFSFSSLPLLPPFPSRWAEEEAEEEAAEASPRSAGAAEAAEASTRSGRAALPMQLEEAGASPRVFQFASSFVSLLSSLISLSLSLTMYSSHSITNSFSHERGRGRGRGGHGGGGGGRGDGSGRNNGNFFGNRDEGEQAAVSPFEFEPRFF